MESSTSIPSQLTPPPELSKPCDLSASSSQVPGNSENNLPIKTRIKRAASIRNNPEIKEKINFPALPTSPVESFYRSLFCPKCGYWRHHSIHIGEHRTCICSLLSESSICCIDGYSSLMHNIPSLMYWSPIPNKYISDIINIPR